MGDVWSCKIGEVPDADIFNLPLGADAPMRKAVEEAYLKLTGKEAAECFSGWGASWTGSELEAMGEFEKPEVVLSPILRYFEYAHLPEKLQRISRPFCQLAVDIEDELPSGPEKSVALRKLLEAKDAAVRAALDL